MNGTPDERAGLILEYIRIWGERYHCPCPTAALAHRFGLPMSSLELLLLRLQHQGRVRRRRAILGERDVELVAS